MSEQNPKKMSVTQLTLLTAINMMGSGIVMLPTKLAEIGTISILSWVITAFGSLCLAYAFAKCGMFSKRPGMGGYAEYAFGKAGNFLANYTYGISLLFASERHRGVLVQSDPVRRILESASSPFLLCGGGFYFHDALGFLRPGKCLRQQRCR